MLQKDGADYAVNNCRTQRGSVRAGAAKPRCATIWFESCLESRAVSRTEYQHIAHEFESAAERLRPMGILDRRSSMGQLDQLGRTLLDCGQQHSGGKMICYRAHYSKPAPACSLKISASRT
jgi:hypothetical protein